MNPPNADRQFLAHCALNGWRIDNSGSGTPYVPESRALNAEALVASHERGDAMLLEMLKADSIAGGIADLQARAVAAEAESQRRMDGWTLAEQDVKAVEQERDEARQQLSQAQAQAERLKSLLEEAAVSLVEDGKTRQEELSERIDEALTAAQPTGPSASSLDMARKVFELTWCRQGPADPSSPLTFKEQAWEEIARAITEKGGETK